MIQLQSQPTLNFVNTVVIGAFNPAILTSNFLLSKCKFDLGNPSQEIHQHLISQISYKSYTWFMDLQRFQVQELDLNRPEDLVSPDFVLKYLSFLPHTPINMAGININISYVNQGFDVFWKRLSDPNIVMDIVTKYKTSSCEIVYGNSVSIEKGLELRNVLIVFKTENDVKIQINVNTPDQIQKVIINYNWEIEDFEKHPQQLQFLAKKKKDIIKLFQSLLKAFMEESI